MTRYSHLLETRNRFAIGDFWRGRACGADACVRWCGGRADARVVDDGGGADFTSIHAVVAASERAMVEMRAMA